MKHRTISMQGGLALDAAFKRAVAMQQQGNLPEAEKLYQAILKQHPKHFPSLFNLALGLLGAERFDEAARYFRRAVNQESNSAAAHAMLASTLQNLNRSEEALKSARRAVALDAGFADAHAILAKELSVLGRYDEARSALARAMELAPNQPRHYYNWGQIAKWTAHDPRLATLEALAQKSQSLPLDDQVFLQFALAKAHADCGHVERAFRHQIDGGALKRRMLLYDEVLTFRGWDGLRRNLGSDWLRQHQQAGDPSTQPVFILGMARSGTTLVEQILASHPQVEALGERPFFGDALARGCGMPVIPPSLGDIAAKWSDSQLRRLGAIYLELARREAPGVATRTTDKMPGNFRFIGLIHATLPNARIIHTRRDPVDTCLSIFSTLFAGDDAEPYSYDLGELGRYYRAYEKMMTHWRDILPPGIMLEVRYEDVVDDVEGQARRILAHCGLEWDDACLSFHKTERPVRTASHAQVRQPIYRSSVGRERPPRELLKPLLEALDAECRISSSPTQTQFAREN